MRREALEQGAAEKEVGFVHAAYDGLGIEDAILSAQPGIVEAVAVYEVPAVSLGSLQHDLREARDVVAVVAREAQPLSLSPGRPYAGRLVAVLTGLAVDAPRSEVLADADAFGNTVRVAGTVGDQDLVVLVPLQSQTGQTALQLDRPVVVTDDVADGGSHTLRGFFI